MNLYLLTVGYRRISADAQNRTALLNLCMECEFSYTDFAYRSDGGISFCCQRRVARRILQMCEARGIAVQDCGGGGFLHLLWRYRMRWGLCLGGLLAALMIWVSGQFVWDVRVSGNATMSEREVCEILGACGFGVGSYIPDFSGEVIETRVMIESDRIAWISIYMDGTVAQVQIRENEAPPNKEPTRPANLVAAYNGEIELLELYRGSSVVKIGQTVSVGDLLVSGVYDSSTVGYRYTRAAGKVLARVEEDFCIEIPLCEQISVQTDDWVSELWLDFFDFSLKIFKNSRNCNSECDIIKEDIDLEIFGLRCLPFGLTVCRSAFREEQTVMRTAEEALDIAYQRLDEMLCERAGVTELLQKSISTELTDTSLVLTCRVVCIRDIALQQEFDVLP